MNDSQRTAVILLAHGTRDADASAPVFEYAQALSRVSGLPVEPCLREFIEPSLSTVVEKLVSVGSQVVVVIPFFLFKSNHVTRDIASDVLAEQKKYPFLRFEMGEPLGFEEAIVGVLKERLSSVLQQL